jgi:hypothetical protein
MLEYLAEVYVMPTAATLAAVQFEDLSLAADELTREGTPVRLVSRILVPEDETCFYLYEAASRQSVREAGARAGLPFAHVSEAVSVPRNASGDAGDVAPKADSANQPLRTRQ